MCWLKVCKNKFQPEKCSCRFVINIWVQLQKSQVWPPSNNNLAFTFKFLQSYFATVTTWLTWVKQNTTIIILVLNNIKVFLVKLSHNVYSFAYASPNNYYEDIFLNTIPFSKVTEILDIKFTLTCSTKNKYLLPTVFKRGESCFSFQKVGISVKHFSKCSF